MPDKLLTPQPQIGTKIGDEHLLKKKTVQNTAYVPIAIRCLFVLLTYNTQTINQCVSKTNCNIIKW